MLSARSTTFVAAPQSIGPGRCLRTYAIALSQPRQLTAANSARGGAKFNLGSSAPLARSFALASSVPRRDGARCLAAPSNIATTVETVDAALLKSFTMLQNGSDIRGVAIDLNPGDVVTLTAAKMFFIGGAFADWLSEQMDTPASKLRLSVGEDCRLSSPLVSASLAAGIASRGASATLFGLATTPAMFMSCILPDYSYDGSIMVTASHLPSNRNGAKFFRSSGGLGKPDIAWILQRAAKLAAECGMDLAVPHTLDTSHAITSALMSDASLVSQQGFIDVYAEHLRGIVIRGVGHPTSPDRPLEGFKIVVNPGNGAGGFFADKVLGPLGADVSASINLTPDGRFPAHVPNPEDKAAVAATREAVLSSGADLGIMLDTDVDRSGVVDRSGEGINRNKYIALMAAIALRDSPGETVVTDSCTSNGLATFIKALGGKHFRYKKGYKNIIDKGMELNNSGEPCPLMMETSGHGAMRENFFLDDGAYGALKIVIEAVRRRLEGSGDVSEMLESLTEPVEAMEIRVNIKSADVAAESARVTAGFKEWMDSGAGGEAAWTLEAENYEGWRVKVAEPEGKEGWILLRPSLHDPDIVINVESEHKGGMRIILQHLIEFFKAHPDYDVCTGLVEDYVYAKRD